MELERDQLQHAIEATKNRHKEEIESIQRSNGYGILRCCVQWSVSQLVFSGLKWKLWKSPVKEGKQGKN